MQYGYIVVQYSAVQYNTEQYIVLQYSAVQYNTVQYIVVQHSVVQFNTANTDRLVPDEGMS